MQFILIKSKFLLTQLEIDEYKQKFKETTSVLCENSIQYEWISSDYKTFFLGINPDITIYQKYSIFDINQNNELSFIHGWVKKVNEDILLESNRIHSLNENEVLDGFFVLGRLNSKGEGKLYTSLYNPELYYAKSKDKFAISNRISSLSKIFNYETFNKKHLASHIQYQHALITYDTIYENVFQIPFGSKIIISDELILERNYDLFYDETLEKEYQRSSESYWDECFKRVNSQVNAFKNLGINDKLVVGITGGMDSRLLFSVYHECISSTFSWGPAYSPEVIAGRMCADEVGIVHKTPSLKMAQSSQNLLNMFPQHVFAREFEMCPWDFGRLYYETIDTITVDGQEFIKTPPFDQLPTKEEVLNSLENKFSWRRYTIPDNYYSMVVNEHRKNTEEFISNIHNIQKFPSIERVLTRGRWAARVHETIFDHAFNIYPLLTNTFLLFAYNSSVDSMKSQEIVFEMIKRSCPPLLDIPLFNKSFVQNNVPYLENKIPGKINYKYEYLVKYFQHLKNFMVDNYYLIDDVVKKEFIENLDVNQLNDQKKRYDESLAQTIYTLLETIVLLKTNDFLLLKNNLKLVWDVEKINNEDTYDEDCLKAIVEYNKDIVKLKQLNIEYKNKIDEYENKMVSNNTNSDFNPIHIIFYDKGLNNEFNSFWNTNFVNISRLENGTLITPNSGNWFNPISDGQEYFLPSKFKLSMELVEYGPNLSLVLINPKGERITKKIDDFKKTSDGNVTIIYDLGNIKYINGDNILEEHLDLGNDISIHIDLWGAKKLIFKEFVILKL